MPVVFDPENNNNSKLFLSWIWNSLGMLNAPQISRRRSRLEEYLKKFLISDDFNNLMKSTGYDSEEDLPDIRIQNYCFENLSPDYFQSSKYFPGYYSSTDHKIYLCSNFIDSEKLLKENFIREFVLSKSSIYKNFY